MFKKEFNRFVLSSLAVVLVATVACRAEEEKEQLVIENGNTVSIEYTLKLDDGTVVDSNVDQAPLAYTQGGGEILPALEAALLGLAVDDTKTVALAPEQGYGPSFEEAFQEVPLESVPEDARVVGAMLMAQTEEGDQRPLKVYEVKDETIVLDFNHPLAGQTLNFDVKILAIDKGQAAASE